MSTIVWQPTLTSLQQAISGVASITVTDGGSGYDEVLQVAIDAPPAGGVQAEAFAEMGVGAVTVTAPGTGFTRVPNVVFSGGDGAGAAATAVLTPFTVGSVNITSGGKGYSSPPAVQFSGGGGVGAQGTAILSGGTITGITVTAAGGGYTSAPTIEISGGGGIGASAIAIVASLTGSITSVTASGGSYSAAPTVVASGSPTEAASFICTINGSLPLGSGTIVTNNVWQTDGSTDTGGYSYGSSPAVTIDPPDQPSGTQASATCTVAAGSGSILTTLTIIVTAAGSGYSYTPGVHIDPPDQTGALANQAIGTATITGALSSIFLFNGGSGYSGSGTLIFTPSGATGTYAVASDVVKSVAITSGGVGYSSQPTISFVGGGGSGAAGTSTITPRGVSSVVVTNPGSGYLGPASGAGAAPPTINFIGGGGSGAAATVVLAPTTLASVTMTNSGFGYSSPPTVRVYGGGGLGALATSSLELVGVFVTNGGYQYTDIPNVTLTAPDNKGSGAAAQANQSNAVTNGDTYSLAEGVTIAAELEAIGEEYAAGIPVVATPISSTYVVPAVLVNWSEVDKATRFAASVSTGWFTWPVSWDMIPTTDPVLTMMRANTFNIALQTYIATPGNVPDLFITETFSPLFALAVPAYAYYLVTLSEVTESTTTVYPSNSALALQLTALVSQAAEFTTYLNTP